MRYVLVSIFFSSLLIIGCAATQSTKNKTPLSGPSPFTHGNVQLTIKQNITTQAEILESFGPPNIATVNASGEEVWSYQKHATVSKSTQSGVYGTVILFGGSSGTSGFEQSTRTMTLIIKFDKSKKVVDFKSMSTSF